VRQSLLLGSDESTQRSSDRLPPPCLRSDMQFDRQAASLFCRPTGRGSSDPILHRLERYNIRTEAPRVRGWPDGFVLSPLVPGSRLVGRRRRRKRILKICFVQVKYTNRSSSNAVRTMPDAEPAAGVAMYAF
jgi:hypothetical protein